MNSIEASQSERLAAELFDQVLIPMALARRACGAPAYFPDDRETGSLSYFSSPNIPRMEASACELPGHGTAEGLIEALAVFWKGSGESDLCSLVPMMRKIASALEDEAVENDGTVSVFCYAMF